MRAGSTCCARRPLPDISFVMEMIVPTRPIGGRRVMKAQLHHLAEVARLRHVRIQLMDPDREDHAALDGPFVLLETWRSRRPCRPAGSDHLSGTADRRGLPGDRAVLLGVQPR
ncbi:Scr1 family TA system antitoxin-like transcriptional regulator [Streptomyces globisporus]